MGKKYTLTAVAVLTASLALTGCESMSNAQKGAAIGAITGAIAGKSTSNHKDKRAFIGAAIGAIGGAAVGNYMDKQEQAFREELAGSGIQVVREGDNIRLIMPSNITFGLDQDAIAADFYPTLNAVANVMRKYDKTFLSIEGHTDNTGAASYNQGLSERRAMSVKRYLASQSIDNARLYTSGFGETRPLVANNSASNRALNRRVEIQVVPNTQ
ncbi:MULTISPECIES: OmpA family protein [Salinivibrio]|uniref:OmpA-like domain-containing protein n=1 Tax=Salinivibrio kushneri TaxID=1908198 RepID=A0AB36JYK4_9GAMM|nr:MULTISPECIES: OmpA family protein [Salinivibrio]MPS30946.1 OmpA family protein [Salinivibrio sp. VYel7]MPX89513.1 OmpA family protein [Salinivibrio sp. VYel1]MPX92347.1 OmpA family protein [Salinivibrio sp. VYel9]MPX97077.1 OmpA family protein [Salinivibrio sp. VYel6]MPX98579.1 OmpA family protein [Salinivibrio sp. VYel4]